MPMRRIVFSCALLCALVALAAQATVSVASPNTTSLQLTKRFKAATGEKLVRNKLVSSPGHYVGYDLGVPTTAKKAKWGTFTVFLVTGADVEADVESLLKNTRTGVLDPASAGGIHWESGSSVFGGAYWQAKKRYGKNVVVKWIGSSSAKKTEPSWKRLHAALLKSTK
jgi:hypothetical protein